VILRARFAFLRSVLILMVGSGMTSAHPPDCLATLGSGFLRLPVALTDFETALRLLAAGFFAIGLGFAAVFGLSAA
jgi:hypothetical protein